MNSIPYKNKTEKEADSIFKSNIKFSISFEKLKQISKFIKYEIFQRK